MGLQDIKEAGHSKYLSLSGIKPRSLLRQSDFCSELLHNDQASPRDLCKQPIIANTLSRFQAGHERREKHLYIYP